MTASWIIREKGTGTVIAETFQRHIAEAINAEKYEAVPILEHLAGVNRAARRALEGGE